MTDIVERLRKRAVDIVANDRIGFNVNDIMIEAADEIERMRTALKDAQVLIDNDLVGPWMAKHKLDEVLK